MRCWKTIRATAYAMLLALLALMAVGCATIGNSHDRKASILEAYRAGDNATVAAELPRMREKMGSGEELMWRLEAGAHDFYTARYDDSVDEFRHAEELVGEYDSRATLSVRDAVSSTGSLLVNDNSSPYRGSCRDRIALSFYKALAYLGAGREDAFRAQVRRLRDAQKDAREQYHREDEAGAAETSRLREEHPEVQDGDMPDMDGIAAYGDNSEFAEALAQCRNAAPDSYADFLNPAALFLSGLSSLRDGAADNAAIDFRQMVAAQPDSIALKQFLLAALSASGQKIPAELRGVSPLPFPLDRNCVYVIVGHGTTAALCQQRIMLPLPGGLVPFAWSRCEFYPSQFRGIEIATSEGRSEGSRLADMDGIMAAEYNLAVPGMVTRIVVRAAIYVVAQELIRHSDLAPTAKVVALVALSASAALFNSADTRSWELLPKELLLAQLPMPADRRLTLTLRSDGGNMELPVTLNGGYGSAIVYVNAPTRSNVSVHVLPLAK